MKEQARAYIDSQALLVAGLIWFAGWGALEAFPSSYWYTATSLVAESSMYGNPVKMTLVREIKEPFKGHWTLVVYNVTSGKAENLCTARATTIYRTDAVLPDPLTLNWLADGKWENGLNCLPLLPGKYLVTIHWLIETPWFLPNKKTQVTSNIFTVEG